ncbi:MAG: hypothetical protein Q9195_003507 [Heterodermia aff. obscurata]
MCYNTISHYPCGHSETTRKECTSGASPAAFRCKASTLPTYIIDPPTHLALCPSCVTGFEAQDYVKHMAELAEIETEISRIEDDFVAEQELHAATLVELLSCLEAEEGIWAECGRHHQQVLALDEALGYWIGCLKVAQRKREREMEARQ